MTHDDFIRQMMVCRRSDYLAWYLPVTIDDKHKPSTLIDVENYSHQATN